MAAKLTYEFVKKVIEDKGGILLSNQYVKAKDSAGIDSSNTQRKSLKKNILFFIFYFHFMKTMQEVNIRCPKSHQLSLRSPSGLLVSF